MHHWSRRQFLGAVVGGLLAAPLQAWPQPTSHKLQASVDTFVKAQGFQGVLLLIRDGRTVLAQAYGMADIEAARRATVDTLYPIASISKWFTALTVLRLVDQGRLNLDAPITDYLTRFRKDTGSRVQLKHLLCNASGIPNGFAPLVKADPSLWDKPFTIDEAIDACCSGDLAFEPGSRFSYDFSNWIIVMGIVETATGQDFAQAVQQLTLDPLGLRNVLPAYAPQAVARSAAGYATVQPPVRKMRLRASYTLASGGYCGTAWDLAHAAQGVYGTAFLSSASLAAFKTVLVPEQSYALGGRVKALDIDGASHAFAWETGRTDGYRSLLAHRLDGKATFVLLNNTDISQKDIDVFAEEVFRLA